MTPLRFALLQLRMAGHFLADIGIPRWLVLFGALASIGGVVKLVDGVGGALAGLYGGGGNVSHATAGALTVIQAFLLVVVAGTAAMRLFEPTRLGAQDPLDSLPISRLSRFAIDVADTSWAPVGFVALLLWPVVIVFGFRAGLPGPAVAVLALHVFLVASQVVFLVLAGVATTLLVAPARLLRRRGALLAGFILALTPVLPLLRTVGEALSQNALPTWFPGTWSALAFQAAAAGNLGAALAWSVPPTAVLLGLIALAYVTYARMFYDRRETILAKLSQRHTSAGRRSLLGRWLPGDIAALLDKEMLAFDRDPNLRVMGTGLIALILLFLAAKMVFGMQWASLPIGGAGFLAIYLAASLGLSSFSHEGKGFPVLSMLPVTAERLLIAKGLANLVLIGSVAVLTSGAVGLALPLGAGSVGLAIVFALAGFLVSFPLAALVTLLAALFGRHASFGRRIISPWAMSYLFIGSTAAILGIGMIGVAAGYFGMRYAVAGMIVLAGIGGAWTLAVVRAARIEVKRTLTGRAV